MPLQGGWGVATLNDSPSARYMQEYNENGSTSGKWNRNGNVSGLAEHTNSDASVAYSKYCGTFDPKVFSKKLPVKCCQFLIIEQDERALTAIQGWGCTDADLIKFQPNSELAAVFFQNAAKN